MTLVIKAKFLEDPVEGKLNIVERMTTSYGSPEGQIECLQKEVEQLTLVLRAILNNTDDRKLIAIADELGFDVEHDA